MNQAVPLYLVLAILAGAALLYLLHRWVQQIVREIATLSNEANQLRSVIATNSHLLDRQYEALKPAADELRTHMAAVPRLLETVARVGSAQLEVVQQQRAAQDEARRNPFGRPNGPLPPRDSSGANLEHDIDAMMRSEGVSREEAMLRLNPTNEQSVWGAGMFDNWRGNR